MFKNELNIGKVKDLFLTYGLKTITMDDISSELGISKKTLYQYITNKKELIEYIFNSEFVTFKNKTHRIISNNENPVVKMQSAYKLLNETLSDYKPAFTFSLKRYYPEYGTKMKSQYRTWFISILEQIIETGIAKKYFNPQIAKEFIWLQKTQLNKVMFNSLESNSVTDREVFWEKIFILQISGLCTSKGLSAIKQLKPG